MDDAAEGAKHGKGHGTAYVADVQTNARGSKGRSWNALSSGNIYVSFIIHRSASDGVATPERHFEHDLELAASLSAMEVIGEHGVAGVKVKWLNDLWIKGHKILGALAEFKGLIQVKGENKYLYVLGVGLNLNSDMRHVTELAGLATSSLCETGRILRREEIFAELCNRLDIYLTKNRADLIELYEKERCIQQ